MTSSAPHPQEPLIRSSLPGWAGLLALFFVFFLLRGTKLENYQISSLLVAAVFLVAGGIEAFQCRGLGVLSLPPKNNPGGFFERIVGLCATILCVSSIYWIFPEYRGSFYIPYYKALAFSAPFLAIFFLTTTWLESTRDPARERDACQEIGAAILHFRKANLNRTAWLNHGLGWLIKLYFLPLMFVYMTNYMGSFRMAVALKNPLQAYEFFYSLLFFVDTAFVCVGYVFANKLIGTHIRSADKTMTGWVSALVCYQPFWGVIGACYIAYGQPWLPAMTQSVLFQIFYCGLILLATIPYIWATIAFGTRFSNLTHRGILCTGPYRYFRHPAYLSKLAGFFLVHTPFLADSPKKFAASMFMFAMICWCYRIRALTEERNLRSTGPEYDAYCQEVAENRKRLWQRLRAMLFRKND